MKKDMTSGKEWKLILLFTLPIMAGNFLQQLYNTADGIVVGNFVGENAFAAVGTCMPLTFLFLSLAMGISIGAGVVVSQFFGAQRYDKLNLAIDTSIILLGAIGIVVSAVAFLITPWLLRTVIAVPEGEILEGSIVYLRIYSCGIFFQFMYNAISSVLRAVGDSKATMIFLFVSAFVNIILDLIFVIVFKWGVAGAAVATIIAQIACAAVSYVYLRRRFKHESGNPWFDRGLCGLILKLGIPSAFQQSIVSIGNVAMQRLVNSFGPVSIAAYTAGNRIDSFVFIPIMGLQSGLATFTGQNIGAGRLDRVKRGLRDTLIMSLSITFIIGLILYLFAPTVITLFGLSGPSLERGVEQVKFLAFCFLIFSSNLSVCGLLQGSGDVLMQSLTSLTALTVRVAASYILVALGLATYSVVWTMIPVGWGSAFIVCWARYFSGGWKKKAVAGRLKGAEDPDAV